MDLHISAEHVFIACGYTDMRKSIDGLSAIIAQQFQMDPFQLSLFLFCGRRRDRFKALLWQGDGFLLRKLPDMWLQQPHTAQTLSMQLKPAHNSGWSSSVLPQ